LNILNKINALPLVVSLLSGKVFDLNKFLSKPDTNYDKGR